MSGALDDQVTTAYTGMALGKADLLQRVFGRAKVLNFVKSSVYQFFHFGCAFVVRSKNSLPNPTF